jgi:hypothetical protein
MSYLDYIQHIHVSLTLDLKMTFTKLINEFTSEFHITVNGGHFWTLMQDKHTGHACWIQGIHDNSPESKTLDTIFPDTLKLRTS